jgi:hypothetical protein
MRKEWNKDGQTRRYRGEVRACVSEAVWVPWDQGLKHRERGMSQDR